MKKKAAKGLKVDFTGVSIGGGGTHIPEGSYLGRPVEATKETSDSSGGEYISWTYEVTEGKHKGTKLYDNTSLQPQALWRLRTALDAMGVETPDGPYDLDLEAIVEDEDIVVALEVEDDKYQGKTRSKIVAVMPAEDAEEQEEEEEASSKKGGKKKGEKEEPETPGEEDVNAMDADELEEVNETFDLGVDLEKFATLKKKRVAVWAALEEAGGEEEKEGGEEITEDSINAMDTEELEAFVKEHKLKVTLDGTTRKKRRTVVAAAKEKELIEE